MSTASPPSKEQPVTRSPPACCGFVQRFVSLLPYRRRGSAPASAVLQPTVIRTATDWAARAHASPVRMRSATRFAPKTPISGRQRANSSPTDACHHVHPRIRSPRVCPTLRSQCVAGGMTMGVVGCFEPSTSKERTAKGWRGMVRRARSNSRLFSDR